MNRYHVIVADPTTPGADLTLLVGAKTTKDIPAELKRGNFSSPKPLPESCKETGFEVKAIQRIFRPKVVSRRQRMADAVSAARDAMAKLHDAMTVVNDIRGEYEEQYDAMPEGWQQSEGGANCEAIKDADCDPDSVLGEVESALNEIEEHL